MVQETGIEGFSFIGSGPLPPSPSSLLTAGALAGLLGKLTHAYDVVILDAPPVLGLAVAPLLSSAVEATLFVIETEGVPARAVRRAIQRLSGKPRPVGRYDHDPKYRSSLPYEIDYSYNYDYGAGDRGARTPRRTPLFLSADECPRGVQEPVA